jgi:hypothetical protein
MLETTCLGTPATVKNKLGSSIVHGFTFDAAVLLLLGK